MICVWCIKLLRKDTSAALVMMGVATSATFVLMLRAAGWTFRMNPFFVWALLPYAAMTVYALAGRRSARRSRAILCACFAVLGVTLWAYLDASFVHVSSTSGLVFLFLPLYLLIGGIVLVELLARLFRKGAADAR